MLIYLDTNFLIEAQKSGTPSNRKFGTFLENGDTFEVSAMVWAEFLCGPLQPGEEDNARIIVGPRHPAHDNIQVVSNEANKQKPLGHFTKEDGFAFKPHFGWVGAVEMMRNG